MANTKTRKRRRKNAKKNLKTKPVTKPFCPRLMFRYDQSEHSTLSCKTMWVCRMCMAFILKQDAVKSHLQRCKAKFENSYTVNEPVTLDESTDSGYSCQICNNVFSRRVALKKHMEKHENTRFRK